MSGAAPLGDHRPDDDVGRSLRDLIPGYSGPADPLLRVGASIRRRRTRRRALLAVGSAATAAAMVAVLPSVVTSVVPVQVRGAQPGGPPERAAPPVPASTASTSPGTAPPVVHPVAKGRVAGADWAVGSTSPGGGARRCLSSDDEVFVRDTVCFDAWRSGAPVTWAVQVIARPGAAAVTRVVGVAPALVVEVAVLLADGEQRRVEAVATPTDPTARFFALVVGRQAAVRSVTPLGAGGVPLGPPVTAPGAATCKQSGVAACADPP